MKLGEHLEALYAETDGAARLLTDPVAFPRRYADPRDQEVAGVVAAMLAFGRVDLFRPVLAEIFRQADLRGGPRAYVDGFSASDAEHLAPLYYRWATGADLALLFRTLQRALKRHGRLEGLFPYDGDLRAALAAAIGELRGHAEAEAGVPFGALPRGFRFFLTSPDDGSACKRWNMFLRWMVRPPREGIDLGLWTSIPTSALVVPLDTHVLRIARFCGLTERQDGSWRTAVEVTSALRRLDPDDPIRFDFSIAHLGISGACKGRFDADVCPACPLSPVCVVSREAGQPRGRRTAART